MQILKTLGEVCDMVAKSAKFGLNSRNEFVEGKAN